MSLNPTAGTLLGFLHEGPCTGWELWGKIERSVGNFWNVTRSQVYRELPRLAENGFVTAGRPGVRDQQPYRLTAKGRTEFRRWLASGPPPETRRIPMLLTTFFAGHLPPDTFADILDRQRKTATAALEHYAAIEDLPLDEFQAATLRFGQEYTRLVQRWIDDVARPLADQPPPAERSS